MKRLLVQLVVVSAIVIIAWWPLAEREMHGPWLATHVVIPVAIAVMVLLVFRLLRSLIVAVLCGLALAGLIAVLFRHYGAELRPLLERFLPS